MTLFDLKPIRDFRTQGVLVWGGLYSITFNLFNRFNHQAHSSGGLSSIVGAFTAFRYHVTPTSLSLKAYSRAPQLPIHPQNTHTMESGFGVEDLFQDDSVLRIPPRRIDSRIDELRLSGCNQYVSPVPPPLAR